MNKIYNRLSESYDRLYLDNIGAFQQAAKSNGVFDFYVDFYPTLGSKERHCDLLFYGQAVNGWSSFFNTDKQLSSEHLDATVRTSNPTFNLNSPLDRINARWCKSQFYCHPKELQNYYHDRRKKPYWYFRSFFWNVIYKTASRYYGLDEHSWDWAKKIAWSNLYKIAPDGSNPNSYERDWQMDKSIELVQKEIEEIKPKFCIVLTNYDWWKPFGQKLKERKENVSYKKIQSVSWCGETKIIVTKREHRAANEPYVSELLQELRK